MKDQRTTDDATPQQHDFCLNLARRGYRRVSTKYGIVARVDRPDWVQVLAKQMGRAVSDFCLVDTPHTISSGWADHYRRCISLDKITLDPAWLVRLMPGSDHDPVGFIDDDGVDRQQMGVYCMLHGYFEDAIRCPMCIAPDMLLKALHPVISEIREGADYDARWEALEEAYDLLIKEADKRRQPSDTIVRECGK